MSELIDRQAALDVLCDACGNCACPKGKIPRCSYYEKMQAIPTSSPWHRAEDGLPEIGKIVLVYDDWDRLSICQLDNQYRWLRQGGGWFDAPYVRYWMPIEPPKE